MGFSIVFAIDDHHVNHSGVLNILLLMISISVTVASSLHFYRWS